MLSPSLSFRRPVFLAVAAPIFAVISGLAAPAAAEPLPPPPAPVPAPVPPPAAIQQPPQWAPPAQSWGAPPAPGYWPQYVPAAPPSAGFYPRQEPFSLPPPTPKEAAHPTLMKLGIAASIGGVATLIAGSILMSIAKDRVDVYRDGPTYCCSIDDAPLRNAGITMLVIGGLTATVGIPLWMIGGRRVPVRKTTQEAPASASPRMSVGIGRASFSWQF